MVEQLSVKFEPKISPFKGEAIPENLKNMLLVMINSANVFEEDNTYRMERDRLSTDTSQETGNGEKVLTFFTYFRTTDIICHW